MIEGPTFPLDQGLDQVARLVREGADAEPGELAAEVLKVAELTGHSDDAAVLVLRHDAAPPP